MLRINTSLVANPEGAVLYFDTELEQDRKDNLQREIGQWHGIAARKLLLSGRTTRFEFSKMAFAQDPKTGEQLTPRINKLRRCGYDCTFTVPKSVSLAIELGGNTEIAEIVRESARDTMLDMEAHIQTRVRKGGMDENRSTCNFAYAMFTHHLTTPVNGLPDPDFHLHCFVFNVTWDYVEMRWKAAEFGKIKENAPEFERAFHKRLIERLQAVGIPLEQSADHLNFELSDIAPDLCKRFSKRTRLIEEKAKSAELSQEAVRLVAVTGMTYDEAIKIKRAEIGPQTREKKSKKPFDQVHASWLKQMTPEEKEGLKRSYPEKAEIPAIKKTVGWAKQIGHALSGICKDLGAKGLRLCKSYVTKGIKQKYDVNKREIR